ncbi:membrane protein insertion efficiency factor YidD [Pseudonocardia sp. GCM10023141]|uniref:membrane protein insertion efficiency factor YidD n=1 Tax=Pseudonocardia sp. GCM10023141 TaxID=3252653 RepID=UPI003610754F
MSTGDAGDVTADEAAAGTPIEARRPILVRALIAVVRGYQRHVSPALPPSCRFYPSCSAYAVEALQVHGALRGTWLTVRRLLRCAPWHPGGIDLVPPARDDRPAQEHREEQAPC